MRAECLLCVLGLIVLNSSICAKLPSWRGPDIFFDGILPSGRESHGFASCDDGKIYVFGGAIGLECETLCTGLCASCDGCFCIHQPNLK
jgi:hypothetical protein